MENVLKKIVMFIPRRIKRYVLGNIPERIQRQEQFQRVFIKQIKQAVKTATGIDFQGQIHQDMFAWSYFDGKKDGFYIDIGANDGKYISNTYIFEKLGWGGACIEPLPDVFEKLRKNRSCDCFNVAISDVSGESIEFIRAKGVEVLSGLSSQMTEAHKERIRREKGEIEKIYVKTLTFDDLMSNYPDTKHIDFMSIDVEGAEMSVLKTIDFKKYSFGFITLENNEEIKRNSTRLITFMQKRGYKVYLDYEGDIMFVPNDVWIV
ncbi:MAG: FkbM family methyltransferase [Chitinivibrionia bacterium]|nr:FkbM family methyltransferase [Chitinivibrionia bacterium]